MTLRTILVFSNSRWKCQCLKGYIRKNEKNFVLFWRLLFKNELHALKDLFNLGRTFDLVWKSFYIKVMSTLCRTQSNVCPYLSGSERPLESCPFFGGRGRGGGAGLQQGFVSPMTCTKRSCCLRCPAHPSIPRAVFVVIHRPFFSDPVSMLAMCFQ